MSRKEAILNLREVLIKRRDALRRVLAGDLSSLKELRAQASGDVAEPKKRSAFSFSAIAMSSGVLMLT